jgi:hypothetical protein
MTWRRNGCGRKACGWQTCRISRGCFGGRTAPAISGAAGLLVRFWRGIQGQSFQKFLNRPGASAV